MATQMLAQAVDRLRRAWKSVDHVRIYMPSVWRKSACCEYLPPLPPWLKGKLCLISFGGERTLVL